MSEWVPVCETEDLQPVEIETDDNGTLPLSSITAHFPGTTTLKFRAPGGTSYRGVKMKGNILIPPTGGWSAHTIFIAVNPNVEALKRKNEEEAVNPSKRNNPPGILLQAGINGHATGSRQQAALQEHHQQQAALHQQHAALQQHHQQQAALHQQHAALQQHHQQQAALHQQQAALQQHQQQQAALPSAPRNKLYLSGLSEDTKSVDLVSYFSKFNMVVDVQQIRNQSGEKRGFGFITMEPGSDVTKTEGLLGLHSICGRNIKAAVALPKPPARNTYNYMGLNNNNALHQPTSPGLETNKGFSLAVEGVNEEALYSKMQSKLSVLITGDLPASLQTEAIEAALKPFFYKHGEQGEASDFVWEKQPGKHQAGSNWKARAKLPLHLLKNLRKRKSHDVLIEDQYRTLFFNALNEVNFKQGGDGEDLAKGSLQPKLRKVMEGLMGGSMEGLIEVMEGLEDTEEQEKMVEWAKMELDKEMKEKQMLLDKLGEEKKCEVDKEMKEKKKTVDEEGEEKKKTVDKEVEEKKKTVDKEGEVKKNEVQKKTEKEKENLENEKEAKIAAIDKLAEEVKKGTNTRNRDAGSSWAKEMDEKAEASSKSAETEETRVNH